MYHNRKKTKEEKCGFGTMHRAL